MFARVRLLTSDVRDSLVIPEESIFPVGDDKFVYKVVEGRAERQKIEIGQRRDGKVEVLAGLGAQDRIVTAGVVKVRDGAMLKVAATRLSPPFPHRPFGKAETAPAAGKGS